MELGPYRHGTVVAFWNKPAEKFVVMMDTDASAPWIYLRPLFAIPTHQPDEILTFVDHPGAQVLIEVAA